MYNHPPEGGVKHNKMSEIKLEVGKTYRNRKGEEVKIVKHDGGSPWPYCGSSGKGYAADGKWASRESSNDLTAEVPEPRYTFITPDVMKGVTATRHTFAIPEGVKEITLDYFGNRIVVEMVPKREPKPGDVCVNEKGSVYIFKEVAGNDTHRCYARRGESGKISIGWYCNPGRPATPDEAQPLWDALKEAGKRWNPKTMQVEDVPEIDRILEWLHGWAVEGDYDHQALAEVIGYYLKHKEGEQ